MRPLHVQCRLCSSRARICAYAKALQASVAQQWGREMESQVSATHAAAAARQEELEGVISALNQQLDLLSHQPQVSLYSHFDGPGLFGSSMQWMQDPGFPSKQTLQPFSLILQE